MGVVGPSMYRKDESRAVNRSDTPSSCQRTRGTAQPDIYSTAGHSDPRNDPTAGRPTLHTVITLTSLRGRSLSLAAGLTAALTLAACSQTPTVPTVSPPSTTSPSTSPSATSPSASTSAAPTSAPSDSPSASAGRRIEISVKGKQVTPAPATVSIAVGESLTLAITSDHDDTIHAHAFEIKKDIKAGKQAEITIKGAQTGTYEIELHSPALRLLQIAVS